MITWPRISIVTPSFNQGRFIGDTIESVIAQDYPNLEHIVIDGASSDNTLEVLRPFTHLKVVSEPDHGQAEAINKGFAMATGRILAFLNSDDTLLPGALRRVAEEMASNSERHVVMGRCLFVDEQGRFIGIEHPCHFQNHARVLKVWKGHTIPQPSVFWTRDVWAACGPMDERLQSAWVDYDFFCRTSGKYKFHIINQVLSTYRLHSETKTGSCSDNERLEDTIRISRRYWGVPISPLFWNMAMSLTIFRFDRLGRGRRLLQSAKDLRKRGARIRSIEHAIRGAILAPEIFFYQRIFPFIKKNAEGLSSILLHLLFGSKAIHPQTAAHLNRTEAWEDGWVGPTLIMNLSLNHVGRRLLLKGTAYLSHIAKPLLLDLTLDGNEAFQSSIDCEGEFELSYVLSKPAEPGEHTIKITANPWFVPHRIAGNGDYRPLAWRFGHIEFY
jgi:glycosyltransferase involved in cell wall biosynthesis